MTEKKIGTMKLTDKTENHAIGGTLHFVRCDVCGTEVGATDLGYLKKNEVGRKCVTCRVLQERKQAKDVLNIPKETKVWD